MFKCNFLRLLLFFCSLGSLCSCHTGIHLLGVGKKGLVDIKVPKEKYSKKLGQALADVHDSVIGPANTYLQNSSNSWNIEWFNIGIGLEGKLKLAHLKTVGATPRVRLYFRKN